MAEPLRVSTTLDVSRRENRSPSAVVAALVRGIGRSGPQALLTAEPVVVVHAHNLEGSTTSVIAQPGDLTEAVIAAAIDTGQTGEASSLPPLGFRLATIHLASGLGVTECVPPWDAEAVVTLGVGGVETVPCIRSTVDSGLVLGVRHQVVVSLATMRLEHGELGQVLDAARTLVERSA
jgi:hypothetical protein